MILARDLGRHARVARRGGWRRAGSKGRFRYLDARGNRIEDPAKIERIEQLVIPPAWKDVWISPRAEREAPGDRRRQGRAAPVPLPPRIPRAAGAGEVRQARPLRRAAAGPARWRWPSTWTLDPLRPRARLRGRRPADQPRRGSASARTGTRKTSRTHGVTTLTQAATSPCAARGSRSASARSTASRCGRRSSTPSSPRRSRSCSTQPGGARVFRYALRTASRARSRARS